MRVTGGLPAFSPAAPAFCSRVPARRRARIPTGRYGTVVPLAAAGPTDVVARLIAQKLSEKFGQQFYTENMGGAGGNLGMAAVARSPADGYTILFSSSSYTVNPSLYAKSPYDPDKDFAPPSPRPPARPTGCSSIPAFPAKSVKELVDLLKANPGKYTFASPGIGTTPHLSSELFKLTFGLDFALAPFPGGGPSIQSVVGGHTPMCFQAIPPATPLVKDGKLRARLGSPRDPLAGAARRPHARRTRNQGPGGRDHAGRAGSGRHAETDRRSADGNCAHRQPARRQGQDAGDGPRTE